MREKNKEVIALRLQIQLFNKNKNSAKAEFLFLLVSGTTDTRFEYSNLVIYGAWHQKRRFSRKRSLYIFTEYC